MRDLIDSSTTAKALLVASFVALVVSEVSIRLREVGAPHGVRKDRGSILAVVGGIAAGGFVGGWCSSRIPDAAIPGRWVVLVLALVLLWSGVALRQWAVWALGRFFTVVVRVDDTQQVVDRGPFRWVRHPSYTGLLLSCAGIGVAMGTWLSLAAMAVLPTAGVLVRIRVEERALLTSLAGYREYARGRRRLVPGLW